jgi:hypothetical protein
MSNRVRGVYSITVKRRLITVLWSAMVKDVNAALIIVAVLMTLVFVLIVGAQP